MGRKNSVRKLWQKIRSLSQKDPLLKVLLFLIAFLSLSNAVLLYFYFCKPRAQSSTPPILNPVDFRTSNASEKIVKSLRGLPILNLDSIFSSDHSWTATLSAEKRITLITTGDVIPARSVNYQMTKRNDFTWPFAKTYEFLKSADITLINLESPLVKDCPITNTGMIFCGNQRFIEGLNLAGIDVANLANNHSLNYGVEGLEQTIELLEKNHILTSGQQPSIKKVKDTTFGFLGFDFLTSPNQSEVLQLIKEVGKKVDILVVSAHWSAEYTHSPSAFQKELACQIIDEGGDIIVGNHPHWIQPVEIYKEKPIIYAHGNFIFDQEWSEKTKLGVVAKFTIFDKKVVDIEFKPLKIVDFGQPYWLEGKEKEKVLELLEEISKNHKIIFG